MGAAAEPEGLGVATGVEFTTEVVVGFDGGAGCEDGTATEEVVATAVDEATSVEEVAAAVVVGAALVVSSARVGPKGKHFSSMSALYSC